MGGCLVVIVDYNDLSSTDFIKKYLDVAPLEKKWESFGWETAVINSHSFKDILSILGSIRLRSPGGISLLQ